MLPFLSISLAFIPLVFGSGDEFMSCDRYFESQRSSRVLDQIPCDMSKSMFCKHKGPSYPEASIWRFKEENRALMRRMYGDMESTSLYREMRSSMGHDDSHSRAFDEELNPGGQISSLDRSTSLMPDLFSSLEYNIRVGSGLATVQSAKEPILGREAAGQRVKVKRKVVKKKRKEPEKPEVMVTTTTSSSSVQVSTSESPSPATTTTLNDFSTTFRPNPTTVVTYLPTTNTQSPNDDLTTIVDDSVDETTTDVPETLEEPQNVDSSVSQLLADIEDAIVDGVSVVQHEDTESEYVEYEDDPSATPSSGYEDYEYGEGADYSGESLNACPVKEEVFAPYWANNTRNQVLALLNLYPFEQYIHMETCKYEHEEMLCRRGCKCEQQYRLHRLLAFDPNNECRGIFSDWFRFPSYCICKCYNVPEEFLASRPRNPRKSFSPAKTSAERNSAAENSPSLQNIPAIMPYEAKQALLRELTRKDRDLSAPNDNKENGETIVDKKDDSHFFYGNLPVTEFKLADGSVGTMRQVPRK